MLGYLRVRLRPIAAAAATERSLTNAGKPQQASALRVADKCTEGRRPSPIRAPGDVPGV